MAKSRKPSPNEAISAQARNGMGAFTTYKFRKFYKENAYPELPPDYGVHELGFTQNPEPIDLWHDKPYFGRYDLDGNPIYVLEENLKILSAGRQSPESNESIFAVNFVVDAYNDLQDHFNQAARASKVNPDFPLIQGNIAKAYVNPENLYRDYINKLFELFILTYIGKQGLHCSIDNFEDFVKHFRDYFKNFGLSTPLTFSSFIGSKRCPVNICGLIVDLQSQGCSDDTQKTALMKKDDFAFFISSAKNHGFLVDKNSPWRLVADVSSPKMQEYMKKYVNDLNKDNLFRNYYAKAYIADVEMIMNNIVSFYNNYIESRPYNSKSTKIFTRGNVGTTKEIRKTVTKNKKRNKIGLREVIQTYGIEDVLDFWFTIKCYEVGAQFSDFSKQSIIEEAMTRKKVLGLSFALSYLNGKITNQVKINLTAGAEYVKGNNDKARILLGARSSQQPKEKEPNIKDVISGDYSRK